MTTLFVEHPLLVPGFNKYDIAYSVFVTYFTVSDTFEGTYAQIWGGSATDRANLTCFSEVLFLLTCQVNIFNMLNMTL